MNGIVYRSYTKEALDAQLNNRLRHPEYPEVFKRWSEESRKVAESFDCRLHLAYGSSQGERLDIFPANGGEGRAAPLLAFIHGGWWQSLDKADFNYLAPAFLKHGIAYASINYDLAPKATIPQITEQVLKALAWLRTNAAQFGVDPQRIYIAGHSAGGHLVAMCFATDWRARGLTEEPFAGGLSISGIYDLAPLPLSYQQPVLRLTPEAVESHSPGRLEPRSSRPLICAVGADESEEFLLQQDDLLTAWRPKGADLRVVELPGRNHFTAVDSLGEASHALHKAMLALIKAA